MQGKIELPINKNVGMLFDTVEYIPFLVPTCNDYGGNVNMLISEFVMVEDGKSYDCIADAGQKMIKKDRRINQNVFEGKMQVVSEPYVDKKYAFWYMKTDFSDSREKSLHVRIDNLQNSHALSSVKLLFTDGIRRYDEIGKEVWFADECSMMLTAHGKLVFHYKSIYKKVQLDIRKGNPHINLRIQTGKYIEAQYSLDGKKWSTLWKTKNKMLKVKCAGIYICPRVNPFYYEFFQTQLQLTYNKTTKQLSMWTDENAIMASMLDMYCITRETLPFFCEDVIAVYLEFVKRGFYICVRLDAYYIFGRKEYQKQHMYATYFIYGFDEEYQKFLAMEYDNGVHSCEVSYGCLQKADVFHLEKDEVIKIYRYNSKKKPDKLPRKNIEDILTAYVEGKAVYGGLKDKLVIDYSKEKIYGIQIWDFLSESGDMRADIIKHPKKLNVYYRHFQMLLQIINILWGSGCLSDREYEKNQENFRELCFRIKQMITFLESNQSDVEDELDRRIKREVKQIREFDRDCMMRLLEGIKDETKSGTAY